MKLSGTVSWFGGPDDTGVDPDEGLAFIQTVDDQPSLFLPKQPPGTTGLARRLDPEVNYIACRWDYDVTPHDMLLSELALVRAKKTGITAMAMPADWGPHESTGRIADISPGLMETLGIETDDEVEVTFPAEAQMKTFVISSGHGKYVSGAVGIIDEVEEARRVVAGVVDILRRKGAVVYEYHDDVSHTQNENLSRIVDFHNSKVRDLDVSVHFNSYEPVNKPMGTECLHMTQPELAADIASAIAESGGLINRGAKQRTDLYFLNHTEEPAILIEVCFVDSSADVDAYGENFEAICESIANVLVGEVAPIEPEPPTEEMLEVVLTIKIEAPPNVKVTIRQEEV